MPIAIPEVGSHAPLFNRVISALVAFLLFVSAGGAALAQAEAAATAGATAPLPSVLDVRVSTTADRARLVLDLGARTEFALVSLDEPARLAIDVRAGAIKIEEQSAPAGEGLIDSFTVEQTAPDRVRTTLTLEGTAQVQQAYVLEPFADQPARLVVDIIPATPEVFAENVARDLAKSQEVRAAVVETPAEPPVAAAPAPIVAETRPLVVIDPGHGGIDSGAEAASGIKEKDIVLAFSQRLQEILVDSGKFDVALTREDDTFLRLEERVMLARQNKADLFISVHADSFQQPEIRGASVYTRDENATDVLDAILAEQENKSDIVAGFAVPQTAPQVVDILVDLMRREMRVQSFMAARSIVDALEPSVQLRRFPVRQADFFVLQAPDVPSVLIELGFLSNATDIANLTESGWQESTAQAIARGITGYFDEVEMAQVAQ